MRASAGGFVLALREILISVDTTNQAPIYRLLNTTRAYVASIDAD